MAQGADQMNTSKIVQKNLTRGLKPSVSKMYFCDREFNVYHLPLKFEGDFFKPEKVK